MLTSLLVELAPDANHIDIPAAWINHKPYQSCIVDHEASNHQTVTCGMT
jgi:hypothetical protein